MNNIKSILAVLFVAFMVACGQKQGAEPPETSTQAVPPPQAPMDAPFMQGQTTSPVEEGKPLALKLTGLNSVEELNRSLAKLSDAESKHLFEEAFRRTFTTDPAGRNYIEAEAKFRQVLEKNPKSAETYRGLGYALFNQGQAEAALRDYLKATEINPDYGEAHYALAFLYAMGDTAKGKQHYQKAMQLGIPDERNLGERFYK